MNMITKNLYQTALIEPCSQGADELRIVSGYATSAMASRHIGDLQEVNPSVKISLLVGMCPTDGIALGNHRGFQSIVSANFACGYITSPPPVHGKLYIWYKKKQLLTSFIGSANYTQSAFFNRQREILSEFVDEEVTHYYELLERNSINCTHNEVEDMVRVCNDKYYYERHPNEEGMKNGDDNFDVVGLQKVTVSLLDRTHNVPHHSGLNWGHRDNYQRDRNQAYFSLPPKVYKSDFFPPPPQHFTVRTDDDKTIICVRAQKEYGNAIHSRKNSEIGEYIRNRIGVASGALITLDHLRNYGRTDVTFYKLDEEHFLMNFAPK